MSFVGGIVARCAAMGLAAVALLGACSSDDDPSAVDEGSTTASTASASDSEDETTTAETTTADETTEAGDGEAASGLGVDHLCELVPEDVVEDVLGISVQVGNDTADDCTYDQERSDEALAVVSVILEAGGADQYAFDRSHPVGSSVLEDVADLGDQAFYDTGFQMLRVLAGDTIITVAVIDSNVTDKQGTAIELAAAVLGNL